MKLFKRKPKLFNIKVKIIKNRSGVPIIEETEGREVRSTKESETPILKLKNGKVLDNFDRTKVTPEGYLVLIEKPDGQLAYAKFDEDKISSTGEGLLRDGYFLNQEWIDRAFPKKESAWRMWIPVLVILFGVISIAVSGYLTYNYWKDLNKQRATEMRTFADAVSKASSVNEKISRSLEIATENQKEILNQYAKILEALKGKEINVTS